MNWHERYTQQARWTQDLRAYLLEKAGITSAEHVLEVGCGTGAILETIHSPASLYGLDIAWEALKEAGIHVPGAYLTRGDALHLPHPDFTFDITFCHYLLLWVSNPVEAAREMARVTRPGGNVLALAEPDHSQRTDKPDSLAMLGKWQMEALQRQGANPSFGARLADTFRQAGIEVMETGTIQQSPGILAHEEWEMEWKVLQADLADTIQAEKLARMKMLDKKARADGERILFVPTYFAWGRV